MIVEVLEFLKDKKRNKQILNIFSYFLTVFILLSSLNAFAQEVSIDPVEGYKAQNELSSSSTGDNQANVEKTAAGTMLGSLNVVTASIAPQVLSNYPSILANENIPEIAKIGLIGLTDKANMAMIEGFSGVDIPSYLASEWVPGYDTSTSIYAASDGYSYLDETNVDVLWDRIRLISYIFFVVILIVAGFMIMFRHKIGGQLAVSVFNTLPNIIIALILVTFSFAIVGLLLNIGVMLINVIASILGVTADTAIKMDGPFSLLSGILGGKLDALGINLSVPLLLAIVGGLVIGLIALSGGTAAPALIAGTVIVLLIVIIVAGILIFASIRVYLTLLTAYLGIILNTIMAPIYLTFSAFPGQGFMVQDWLNRIIKGVLTFPVVYFFLNLGFFILKGDLTLGFPSGIMSGDFSQVNTDTTPAGWLIKGLLVIVLFFFAADAPKMLDDYFPVGKREGAANAIAGAKAGLSKIPLVGSFFG